MLVTTLVCFIHSSRKIQMLVVAFWLIGFHTPSAQKRCQKAADLKGLIANELSLQAKVILPREKSVGGILSLHGPLNPGALPVSVRADHELDQMLNVPLAFFEFHGQPIQEFGMRGELSLCAKIFNGPREAFSEKQFPEAIDHDACGQGVSLRK